MADSSPKPSGHARGVKRGEQPTQLRTEHPRVGQGAEQRLDGVEDHPFGADAVDRVLQAHEESFEIVLAGLLNLASLHAHVVDRELLVFLELVQIEPQRPDVGGELLGSLLECHEDSRLVVLGDAADQELHAEEGLAATRPAADQGGATAR